jgi:endonuclease YncB( thermonuclease family)
MNQNRPGWGIPYVIPIVLLFAFWGTRDYLRNQAARNEPAPAEFGDADFGAVAKRPASRVVRVIDGDTLEVDIHLHGTSWLIGERMRLNGINCPEMSTAAGKEAAAFTKQWLLASPEPEVRLSPKRDKYGRLLGNLTRADGLSLSAMLLDQGHAVKAEY